MKQCKHACMCVGVICTEKCAPRRELKVQRLGRRLNARHRVQPRLHAPHVHLGRLVHLRVLVRRLPRVPFLAKLLFGRAEGGRARLTGGAVAVRQHEGVERDRDGDERELARGRGAVHARALAALDGDLHCAVEVTGFVSASGCRNASTADVLKIRAVGVARFEPLRLSPGFIRTLSAQCCCASFLQRARASFAVCADS